MEFNTLFAIIGFVLSGYAVIANDSVQTLGTFIASNKHRKWWYLWIFASVILVGTILCSWFMHGGDISSERLTKIDEVQIQWYHLLAPLTLVALTRFGIPASTSLIILATFSSTLVFEKIIGKSLIGYGLAMVVGFLVWVSISYIFPKIEKYLPQSEFFWTCMQWGSTGFLWYTWLSHDIANTAVFLPRNLSFVEVSLVLVFFVAALAYIFKNSGGKIQEIVLTKTNTTYIRAATMIDLCYAFLLLYFKGMNNIPMSTTWVFIGLLAGREIALALTKNRDEKNGKLFTILRKDLYRLIIGFVLSMVIVLLIQYVKV